MEVLKKKAIIIRKRVPEKLRTANHRVGGVGSYYRALEKHLPEDIGLFDFQANMHNQSFILAIYLLLKSYTKLILSIIKREADVYLINTSLDNVGIFRDGLIALLFRLFKVRFIVFFRGWHPATEYKINKQSLTKQFFKRTFLSSNHIIVLSTQFEKKLRDWGYSGQISIETTVVDDDLIFSYQNNGKKPISPDHFNLFYIGNVIKDKGIYEILEACNLLKNEGKDHINFILAGDGKELDVAKSRSFSLNLPIVFTGYTVGDAKKELFNKADLFVFPSYHEGMPNAVLEAMAFGLPVLTTMVGGIPDFFEEGKMGFYIDMYSPKDIVDKIKMLDDDRELVQKISEFNFQYARRFYASEASKRLSSIIYSVYDSIEPQNP